MSTRSLRRSVLRRCVLRPRRAALAAGLGLLALGVAAGGSHVYENVPLIPFTPVCRDYHRAGYNGQFLHDVDTSVSTEFRQDLVHLLETGQWGDTWFRIQRDVVLTTPEAHFDKWEGKAGDEQGGFRYYLTKKVTWRILQKKIADGAINEKSTQEFHVKEYPYSTVLPGTMLMFSDECGFMEALMTEDGEFARD